LADGKTPGEALTNLENAAESWVAAALAQNLPLPEPFDHANASGKFMLRLPRTLHSRAAAFAEKDGVSLNQFVVATLAERIGAEQAFTRAEALLSRRLTHLAELVERAENVAGSANTPTAPVIAKLSRSGATAGTKN
jgi:antitoxin HicB